MRWDRRLSRAATLGALPIALWAAIPAIQWCPNGAEVMIECLVLDPDPALAAVCTSSCDPRACSPAPNACATTAEGPACGSACDDAPSPVESPPASGSAFCLDDPSGGNGVRPMPLEVDQPDTPAITLAAIVTPEPPPAHRMRASETQARPPTESHRPLPPARAPPSFS
jgi:hypothetical protein